MTAAGADGSSKAVADRHQSVDRFDDAPASIPLSPGDHANIVCTEYGRICRARHIQSPYNQYSETTLRAF
jgi:hypothetical protein